MTPDLQVLDTLQPSNFQLKDGKTPLDICGVTHDRQPISVGIVLDISGSMRAGRFNLTAIARSTVDGLLNASQPMDEYFLEFVNGAPSMWCGFGCDLRHLRAGLEPRRQGRTALIDGLVTAFHEMSAAHHPNRALFVISDGLDNASVHKCKELRHAYTDLPLPIFFLVPSAAGPIFGPIPVAASEVGAEEDLAGLMRRSGGLALAATSVKEGLAQGAQLASIIRSPYMLYFAVPQRPLTALHVEVKGVRPKLRLFYGAAIETQR